MKSDTIVGDGVKLLVDCGGSGIKIKRYVNGAIETEFHTSKPKSFDEFRAWIKSVACNGDQSANARVTGIAVSICGEYDYVKDEVRTCAQYDFLRRVPKLRDELAREFRCTNVCIVNDGDAHALAFKAIGTARKADFNSAINLSLGTAVGFGVLDWRGELLHTCQGRNWEVGHWQCDTKAENKQQWWALGSGGLGKLEEQHPNPKAYVYYGQRLCHFFSRDLVPIFHPRAICLSGGIVAAHYKEIEEGIQREFAELPNDGDTRELGGIDIYMVLDREAVMLGLAVLLDRNAAQHNAGVGAQAGGCLRKVELKAPCMKPLRDSGDWERDVPENRSCALLALHAGKAVCADDSGKAPLVANREDSNGAWETFTLIKNGDGSVSFRSAANDKYVSALPLPDGRLLAQGERIDAWEKFELKKVQDKPGVFNLWSRSTRKYVSVDEGAGNGLLANRDGASAWEEFRIFCR